MRSLSLLLAVALASSNLRLVMLGDNTRDIIPDLDLPPLIPAPGLRMASLRQPWNGAQDGHVYNRHYKAPHFQDAPVYHQRLAPPSRPPKKRGYCRKPGAFY